MAKRRRDDKPETLRESNPEESYPKRWVNIQDQAVIERFLDYAPTCITNKECVAKTAAWFSCEPGYVTRIIRKSGLKDLASDLKEDIKDALFKDKLPQIQNIQNLSATIIQERLAQIAASDEEKRELSVKDLSTLVDVVTKFEDLIRLQTGRPTSTTPQMVGSLSQTINIIKELKEIDPVFEYGPERIGEQTES